jgi:uncharacterized RDD family membrane protein YckC
MSSVITGEAVAIDLRVARLGSRMIGAALDIVVQLILLGLLVALSARVTDEEALAAALFLTSYVVAAVGYPLVLETLWNGRTLGKAAMGLRAVRDDGSPMRFRQALVRALLRAVVEGPTPLFGIPAVVTSMISDRGKRLGDLLAGTVVLQERIPTSGASAPVMPPPLAGWATSLDLSRLDDGLALSARQFLGRAGQLSQAAREALGARLVAAVAERVTPPPPPGTPGWAYLSAVLAERRRREEQRLGVGAGYRNQQYGAQQFGAQGYPPQGYGAQQSGTPQQFGSQQYGAPAYGPAAPAPSGPDLAKRATPEQEAAGTEAAGTGTDDSRTSGPAAGRTAPHAGDNPFTLPG